MESRQFKVAKQRVKKWARDAGLPEDANLSMTQRAETSVSEENDAADDDDHSEPDTLGNGRSSPALIFFIKYLF